MPGHELLSAQLERRKCWAVLVGVNHYEDALSFAQLSVCVSDATNLAECLAARGFDSQRIHVLTDLQALENRPSYENILAKLAAVAENTEEEDLLLFYFSGHGQLEAETGNAYLIPCNGKGAILRRTAVAIQDVKELLLQARARQKVLVLDACHSGADSGRKASGSMSPGFIERVFTSAEGLAILSSCKDRQFSYEWSEKNCSVFTYYLLEALQGNADQAGKGFVTVQDVNAYVVDGVKVWAARHGVSQTPLLNYLVVGDIPIVAYGRGNSHSAFGPMVASMRAYSLSIREVIARARALFERASLPWADECQPLIQAFQQIVVPALPDLHLVSDSQVNSLVIKYRYIVGQVTRLAEAVQDYARAPTSAKQQSIRLAGSELAEEIEQSEGLLAAQEAAGAPRECAEGPAFRDLAHLFADLNVRPGGKAEAEDPLERYNGVPLHALPLYTSEDEEVGAYIREHFRALDSLSGSLCDIYQVASQENAFDFLRHLQVIRQAANPPTIRDIPGLFFWDNAGGSEYIAFGENPGLADIRRILRVVFDHIEQSPAIQAVTRAKAELAGDGTPLDTGTSSPMRVSGDGGQWAEQPTAPTAILTALPEEYVAMEVLLEHTQQWSVPGQGASHRYTLGKIPLAQGGTHGVVLALLPGTGIAPAAASAARLLEQIPQIRHIVVVGIAGGVPNPVVPGEHVRLGDIVVSDQYGVIQYDLVKKTGQGVLYRPFPQPPSAHLLLAARYLAAEALKGRPPWMPYIAQGLLQLHLARPARTTDVLFATGEPGRVFAHPRDPQRKAGQPRVFFGPIASASTLLRDAALRDELRDHFRVKAIEMEATGVASASWDVESGYFVVRGICDYCDEQKNDLWRGYAAVVAAAYTRALLASIPPVALPDQR